MATALNLERIPAPKDTMIVARQDGRLYTVKFVQDPAMLKQAVRSEGHSLHPVEIINLSK